MHQHMRFCYSSYLSKNLLKTQMLYYLPDPSSTSILFVFSTSILSVYEQRRVCRACKKAQARLNLSCKPNRYAPKYNALVHICRAEQKTVCSGILYVASYDWAQSVYRVHDADTWTCPLSYRRWIRDHQTTISALRLRLNWPTGRCC